MNNTTSTDSPLIPPPPAPLNIPPSRARRQLAARLALHKQQAGEAGETSRSANEPLDDNSIAITTVTSTSDPDATDPFAEPTSPRRSPSSGINAGHGMSSLFSQGPPIANQHHNNNTSRFNKDDDDEEDDDSSGHDEAGSNSSDEAESHGILARESQKRQPLEIDDEDEEDDDEEMGEMVATTEGPNSSDEEEVEEMGEDEKRQLRQGGQQVRGGSEDSDEYEDEEAEGLVEINMPGGSGRRLD